MTSTVARKQATTAPTTSAVAQAQAKPTAAGPVNVAGSLRGAVGADKFEASGKMSAMKQLDPPAPAQSKTEVPPAFKNTDGSYKNGYREMQELIDQAPDTKTAVKWLQQVNGLPVDGKIGPQTHAILKDNETLIEQLRQKRLDETPNAKRTPLSPLSPKEQQKMIDDVKNAPTYDDAARQLQQKLNVAGEPMEIDGKIGKGTYESMRRLYGRDFADKLSDVVVEAKKKQAGSEECSN
jgi:Putative peptidoglycan binding domain